MLLQSGYNQPFLVSELLCYDMAIVAFRIPGRVGDIFFQIGILEKDHKKTVLTIQLFQISQLTVHAPLYWRNWYTEPKNYAC